MFQKKIFYYRCIFKLPNFSKRYCNLSLQTLTKTVTAILLQFKRDVCDYHSNLVTKPFGKQKQDHLINNLTKT